jgi:hypothetical protein
MCDCITTRINKFLLEVYHLPYGFVEMVNQLGDETGKPRFYKNSILITKTTQILIYLINYIK